MKKNTTIIIPVYNWATTLPLLFKSLEEQNNKDYIKEIIFIDDKSNDNSQKLIEEYWNKSSFSIKYILNRNSLWLAWNYNLWINACTTDYFILMQQDITIVWNDWIKILTDKIKSTDGKKTLVFYSTSLHPLKIFNTYNFWQQALFSRFVETVRPNLNWRFDIYNKKIFQEKI